MGAIAHRRDRAQHVGEPCRIGAPDHARAARGEIDPRLHDPGLARQPGFDEPDARAAGQAFEQQRGLAAAVGEVADQAAARADWSWRRTVVVRPFRGTGQRAGARRVEAVEPGGVDGLRHGHAARAAEVRVSPRTGASWRRPGWIRQPAVEAGRGRRRRPRAGRRRGGGGGRRRGVTLGGALPGGQALPGSSLISGNTVDSRQERLPGRVLAWTPSPCPSGEGARMYKQILVATDGSKLSTKAVTHAISLAQAVGGRDGLLRLARLPAARLCGWRGLRARLEEGVHGAGDQGGGEDPRGRRREGGRRGREVHDVALPSPPRRGRRSWRPPRRPRPT